MIAILHGSLAEKHPSRLILDVAGVGYDVNVPLSTFYAVGDPGTDVRLRIYTHVREDTLSLFGFATRLEIDLFERLISISGVGPRLALAVLSGLEPPDLVRAIRDANVVRLTGIPGVGKKTAERISLELKDKLPTTGDDDRAKAETTDDGDNIRSDVMSALLNLGYHRPLAERAVADALSRASGGFEETLRELAK